MVALCGGCGFYLLIPFRFRKIVEACWWRASMISSRSLDSVIVKGASNKSTKESRMGANPLLVEEHFDDALW